MNYTALQERIASLADSGKCADDVAGFLRYLCRILRPAYDAILEAHSPSELDRTTSMLYGRPWTSDEFPWPLSKRQAPLPSMLQVDLDWVSGITDTDCGQGLLQVFMPSHFEHYIGSRIAVPWGRGCLQRVIPKSAVEKTATVTPFPWSGKSALQIIDALRMQPEYSHDDSGLPKTDDELVKLSAADADSAQQVIAEISSRLADLGFVGGADRLGPAYSIAGWMKGDSYISQALAILSDEAIISACQQTVDEFGFGEADAHYHSLAQELNERLVRSCKVRNDPSAIIDLMDTRAPSTNPSLVLHPQIYFHFSPDEEFADVPFIRCDGPQFGADVLEISTDLRSSLLRQDGLNM